METSFSVENARSELLKIYEKIGNIKSEYIKLKVKDVDICLAVGVPSLSRIKDDEISKNYYVTQHPGETDNICSDAFEIILNKNSLDANKQLTEALIENFVNKRKTMREMDKIYDEFCYFCRNKLNDLINNIAYDRKWQNNVEYSSITDIMESYRQKAQYGTLILLLNYKLLVLQCFDPRTIKIRLDMWKFTADTALGSLKGYTYINIYGIVKKLHIKVTQKIETKNRENTHVFEETAWRDPNRLFDVEFKEENF